MPAQRWRASTVGRVGLVAVAMIIAPAVVAVLPFVATVLTDLAGSVSGHGFPRSAMLQLHFPAPLDAAVLTVPGWLAGRPEGSSPHRQ